MNSRNRFRAVLRKVLGATAVLTLLGGGLVASAPPASAAPAEVTEATLDWGIKNSFRNYLLGPIAHGEAQILGSVSADEDIRAAGKRFHWGEGSGTGEPDGSTAQLGFGVGNGVHFTGHAMKDEFGEDAHSLDMQFTNPQIEVHSTSAATLYLDVNSRKFVDTTTVGQEFFTGSKVPFASLTLATPAIEGTTLTWTDASATLTDQGAEAFGGYYAEGDELDPATFSMTLAAPTEDDDDEGEDETGNEDGDEPGEGEDDPEPALETSTIVTASPESVNQGAEVKLTAAVTPAEAVGEIQFFNGTKTLGAAVTVASGKATYSTSTLSAGTHSITAEFTPDDGTAFAPSTSDAVKITVTKKIVPVEGEVLGATLDWGVRASFRNYLLGSIAHGNYERLGNITSDANMRSKDSEFHWSGGSGTAMTDGRKADVSFGAGNGVRFRGHEMTVGGKTGHALDMQFTNPRVKINSATSGVLYLDVKSREFQNMSSISNKFYEKKGAAVANLTLPAPTSDGSGGLKWTDVSAILTNEGAQAFGGFYDAGEQLDPLNFTFPVDGDVIVGDATKTTLKASPTKVVKGKPVTLTALVSPNVAGTVKFTYGGKQLGSNQPVSKGEATMKTSALPVGIHNITASFTPAPGSDFGHSVSSPVTVTVTQKQAAKKGSSSNNSSGSTAGSLRWGISSAFAAYTTCSNKEAYGYSHCAKGSINTSGVGSGYLFPQASSGDWNKSSQTGTVRYSGTVQFRGYGQTMFQVVNPTIRVTSPTSATMTTGYSGTHGPSSVSLNLGAATKSVGSNGVVTWSNVPVGGSLMGISAGQGIGLDSLTFTVGQASSVSYGSTEVAEEEPEYTAADTPPTTSGIEVLTPEKRIREGGRIQVRAPGFEPEDSNILVVLYEGDGSTSGPIVLDDTAAANEYGIVEWSGTLPEEGLGEHVITLQGSTDAGAVIDILDVDKKKKPRSTGELNAPQISSDQTTTSGLFGSAGAGGMAPWEWWASAGGLVVIAACMTLLTIRQRRQ